MTEYKAYVVFLGDIPKYVGITKRSIARRWIEHQQKKSPCVALLRSINKHGRESFTVLHVASSPSRDDVSELERSLIIQYGTLHPVGYNLLHGGLGGFVMPEWVKEKSIKSRTGLKRPPMSEEQKAKISATLKGRKIPREVVEKIRLTNTGKKRSPEAAKNIREGVQNRVVHPEEFLRRSEAQKRRAPPSEETKARISAGKTGKKMIRTAEHNAKISAANTGKVMTQEVKDKISATKKALNALKRDMSAFRMNCLPTIVGINTCSSATL